MTPLDAARGQQDDIIRVIPAHNHYYVQAYARGDRGRQKGSGWVKGMRRTYLLFAL